jgi:hypothetical protein
LEIQGYRIISILLISPPKVIYAELFCVKDTPHFFPNLFQNHPVDVKKVNENWGQDVFARIGNTTDKIVIMENKRKLPNVKDEKFYINEDSL